MFQPSPSVASMRNESHEHFTQPNREAAHLCAHPHSRIGFPVSCERHMHSPMNNFCSLYLPYAHIHVLRLVRSHLPSNTRNPNINLLVHFYVLLASCHHESQTTQVIQIPERPLQSYVVVMGTLDLCIVHTHLATSGRDIPFDHIVSILSRTWCYGLFFCTTY